MAEIPFNGYMPLTKILDYFNGELERRGDVWVSIRGIIHTSQTVEHNGENTSIIDQENGE